MNTDILNIIGDHVEKDNVCRLKKEDFESTDFIIGELRYELKDNCITRENIGKAIYSNLNLIYNIDEEIQQYIDVRKKLLKKIL